MTEKQSNYDKVNSLIDELEASTNDVRRSRPRITPAEIRDVARDFRRLESSLLDILVHPEATDDDIRQAGLAHARLRSIDFSGYSLYELVSMAERDEAESN